MKYKQRYYPESQMTGLSHVDGTLAFYSQVNALLNGSSVVLDVGCGRGAYGEDPIPFRRRLRILRGKVSKVIGIDVDEGGGDNPYIDEFRLIERTKWPVPECSVDLCLSDNVLEHVEDPEIFFNECQRVTRPDGYVCIRTSNLLSYFGLIACLTPNHRHVSVLEKAKDRVNEQDTFPTFYRCNTIPTVRRMLSNHGFEPRVFGYDAEPAYLSFSRFFYYLGVLHQRYAPNLFKVGIHAFGKRISNSS